MALPRGLESLIEAGMMHGTVRDCLQEAVEAAPGPTLFVAVTVKV